jgi:hypothetical protein
LGEVCASHLETCQPDQTLESDSQFRKIAHPISTIIKYIPYQEVSASLKIDLENYAEQEFGNVPYVKERVWAQPDWVVLN